RCDAGRRHHSTRRDRDTAPRSRADRVRPGLAETRSPSGNRGSGGLEASSLEAARRRPGEVHGEVATDKKESAMTWTQVYHPLNSWIITNLVAALAIIVLFGILAGLRVKRLWCANGGS